MDRYTGPSTNFGTSRVKRSPRVNREKTRDELLEQLKSEREARTAERHKLTAAGCIQRCYRGHKSRQKACTELLQQWLREFGGAAASPAATVPVTALSGRAVPLLLLACTPPGHRARHMAEEHGSPLRINPATEGAPLRGLLALLMRSVASSKDPLNYCALVKEDAGRRIWLRQSRLLAMLCCGLLGSAAAPDHDMLLELAAARVLTLLLDPSSWACCASGSKEAHEAASDLRAYLGSMPALASAVKRLIVRRQASTGSQASESAASAARKSGGDIQQDTTSKQTDLAVRLAMQALLSTLWPCSASSAPAAAGGARRPDQASLPGWQGAAAGHFVQTIMSSPQLSGMPSQVRTQLTLLKAFEAIMPALNAVTKKAAPSEQRHPGQGDTAMRTRCTSSCQRTAAEVDTGWMDLLWMLANLTGLVAGERQTKQQKDAAAVRFLPKSAYLSAPQHASAYVSTATQLLSRAHSLYRASPQHRTSSSTDQSASAKAGNPLEALWPLAEGTFAAQLLVQLPKEDLVAGCLLYWRLLAVLPDLAPACDSTPVSEEARFVNALALGTKLLPRLWAHLAGSMGLPLEAPKEAKRGWNIASLRQGTQSLPAQHAALLGLFCRVHAQALLVLDDKDFHERQDMLTLGQHRAIATALNSLVFHTHCPAAQAAQNGARAPTQPPLPAMQGVDSRTARRMLAEWAPKLLRELYERDVRRPFCPPALWLEPFAAAESAATQSAEERFNAAAVMRALLQASSGPCPAPAKEAAVVGGRPASLAALLLEAPQCVPFDQRVLIFRSLVAADKERGKWAESPMDGGPRPVEITVRRTDIIGDGFSALHSIGPAIKGRLMVTFVSQHGGLEAGIDHGGLVKEFLEEVVKAGFNADYGLFTSTEHGGLAFPAPASTQLGASAPALLRFLGAIFGKALYEGILLDTPLAPFFVAKLQGRYPLFDDLQAFDPELHRSLIQLKGYEGEAEDLGITFSVEDDVLGRRQVHELCPGGDDMAVTSSNKLLYVHLVADWHLNRRLGKPAASFAAGLNQVIPSAWLRLFNPKEVNELLSGGEGGGVDAADMQHHATYSGGYTAGSQTIKLFWKVVGEMSKAERSALMKFATSVSRAPLGGFKHLNPPLTVHKVTCEASPLALLGGADVDRLPTASTCYNMLKLPNYRRATTLKKKLLYAITSNAGFDLS